MKDENQGEAKYVEEKVKAMRRAVRFYYVYSFLGFGITILLLLLFKKNAIPVFVLFFSQLYCASLLLEFLLFKMPGM